ncbi:hypothetical protein ZWY2020_004474 [Hordeum vulgare]|nr:hypothetical protein ZWY2020_004474 [Hordeum vulgare]
MRRRVERASRKAGKRRHRSSKRERSQEGRSRHALWIDGQVIHVQANSRVCDGPMRKKCKLTVLLMGGTNNPIVLTLASLFKLTFSYNKKEDVDSYSSVSKILPIIALK